MLPEFRYFSKNFRGKIGLISKLLFISSFFSLSVDTWLRYILLVRILFSISWSSNFFFIHSWFLFNVVVYFSYCNYALHSFDYRICVFANKSFKAYSFLNAVSKVFFRPTSCVFIELKFWYYWSKIIYFHHSSLRYLICFNLNWLWM